MFVQDDVEPLPFRVRLSSHFPRVAGADPERNVGLDVHAQADENSDGEGEDAGRNPERGSDVEGRDLAGVHQLCYGDYQGYQDEGEPDRSKRPLVDVFLERYLVIQDDSRLLTSRA